MFRNNPVGVTLVLLLFVLCLSASLWAVRYFYTVREAQALQARYARLQTTLAALQSLVAETIDYSRRSPDLDPLLLQFNLKPGPGTNAAGAGMRAPR
ncbi:MAG: hypothetical protein RJA22_1640 [Verrucomicrobiota bacterium]|jgi:CHASE1-domain containing sensor protein